MEAGERQVKDSSLLDFLPGERWVDGHQVAAGVHIPAAVYLTPAAPTAAAPAAAAAV